jgi:ABC-2 type transport system ATP-binding protein
MSDQAAITISNISKTFKLPHERQNSLKGKLINFNKKGYETQQALSDISFEVKKGEFFGIVGRNGSGKSTLLKLLAGIYKPDSGDIQINGKLTPFIELGVGFNFELSGRDNVYLNGALLGFNRSEMDAMYDDIVAFAELERFMDQKLKNYSSGMQVRLAFSIAIRANSDILVLDEVLAVGDANFQKKCFDYFKRLKDNKKTVILVSHDMDSVKRFSDRALLLENSKVVMIGDPSEISDEYLRRNAVAAKETVKVDADRPPVKVENVRLLENGKQAFDTTNKSLLKVKIDYSYADKKPGRVNFGVGLWSDAGHYVFGYNTRMDSVDIDPDKHSVTLSIDPMPLQNGTYYVNVICFGDDERDPFDYHERVAKFQVDDPSSNDEHRGVLNVGHTWES